MKMQESLLQEASATGAAASSAVALVEKELRFSPGIGKIYKRLHKRSRKNKEGTEVVKVTEK